MKHFIRLVFLVFLFCSKNISAQALSSHYNQHKTSHLKQDQGTHRLLDLMKSIGITKDPLSYKKELERRVERIDIKLEKMNQKLSLLEENSKKALEAENSQRSGAQKDTHKDIETTRSKIESLQSRKERYESLIEKEDKKLKNRKDSKSTKVLTKIDTINDGQIF